MNLRKKERNEVITLLIIFLFLEPLGLTFSQYYKRSYYSVLWDEVSDVENLDCVAITSFFDSSFCYIKPQVSIDDSVTPISFKKGYKDLSVDDTWQLAKDGQLLSFSFSQNGISFYLAPSNDDTNNILISKSVFWWRYSSNKLDFFFFYDSGHYLALNDSGNLVLSTQGYSFSLYDYKAVDN